MLANGMTEGAFDAGIDIALATDFIAGALGVAACWSAEGKPHVERLETPTQDPLLRALAPDGRPPCGPAARIGVCGRPKLRGDHVDDGGASAVVEALVVR